MGISVEEAVKEIQGRESVFIVYSQATQREVVIQALSLGASSYLVKPQKPDVIISKAIEVLHAKSK